jgi:hypothetical protein
MPLPASARAPSSGRRTAASSERTTALGAPRTRVAQGRRPGELTSVTFHYVLRNTGDVPVTVIHLSDEAVPALDVEALSATALAPGERAQATASLDLRETPLRTRQLSTAVLATALTEDGTRVSDAASETLRLAGTVPGDAAPPAADAGTTAAHAGDPATATGAGMASRERAKSARVEVTLRPPRWPRGAATSPSVTLRVSLRTRGCQRPRKPHTCPVATSTGHEVAGSQGQWADRTTGTQ